MSYVFIPTCEIYIKNKDHFEGVFTASIISESKIKTIFNKKELKSYPGELLDDFLQRSIFVGTLLLSYHYIIKRKQMFNPSN